MHRHHDESGETLVEIVISIVLVGAVVSALMLALGTEARASRSSRDIATADEILRSFAERTKQAVRSTCSMNAAGTVVGTYSVNTSDLVSTGFSFTDDVGTLASSPRGCPPAGGVRVILRVSGPIGIRDLQIVVRTP